MTNIDVGVKELDKRARDGPNGFVSAVLYITEI